MSAQSYRLGIVGATGAVGQELIRLLHERNFPLRELVLLASARSAGKQQTWNGKSWTIQEATPDAFKNLDVAIFSAGGATSERLIPEAVKRGCVVIDNSSFFRMDPKVPLVIPDINPHALDAHQGIISNPNCSTAIALMGLQPLHRAFGLKGFFAATYQAVSGTGAQAIQELDAQTRAWAEGRTSPPSVYPHPIAFNLIPHVDKFLDTGYTKEEMKMLHESKKILELPALRVTCTCVRVPVFRAHSIALSAEFERPVDLAKARAAIQGFPGAELCDDPAKNIYPMPIDYTGKHRCGVGRLRKDTYFENGLSLWVSGDQLWRGAALNAVEIAEVLHQRGKLRVN